MKHIALLSFLFLFNWNNFAQDRILVKYVPHEVIYFEGITQIGERLLGIATDRATAQKIIADYMKRNQNNKHNLTYKKITVTTIIAESTTDIYKDFLTVCPRGYQLFSMVNYNSLSIAKNDTKEAAIWYYIKTKNTTPTIAENKVNSLLEKYADYIIH